MKCEIGNLTQLHNKRSDVDVDVDIDVVHDTRLMINKYTRT